MYKNIKGLDKVYGRFILWYTPQNFFPQLFFNSFFLELFDISYVHRYKYIYQDWEINFFLMIDK